MSAPKSFPFDLEQMTEFFKANDFTKAFTAPTMLGVDADAILAAQKQNMATLVAANKAAAAGYQDLFAKIIADFDSSKMDADGIKAEFDKALGNMTALAEGAQKANADAFKVVSAGIKNSVEGFTK